MTTAVVKSVNWHLTSACNYACRFCFARNLGECHLPFDAGLRLISKLHKAGMEKINFAGGEPLLHPRLLEYCKVAKDFGMTVSITTNGYLLNGRILGEMVGVVDWLGLSIDSSSDEVEEKLCRGYGDHVTHCLEIVDKIHEAGIRLKVNTTVTRLTYKENMRPLIRMLNPERWKVFQMLHIRGENDDAVADLSVTDEQYQSLVERHRLFRLDNGSAPVFESANDMESSYFMITPSGNVKIDTGRVVTKYPLDEVLRGGVDLIVDAQKYTGRGGLYDWHN